MAIFIYTLLGLAVGSFLNVAIDRLPKDEILVFPASHCDSCKRPLAWWENVPLISYLALRGRCRTCGSTVPLRVFFVELTTGLLFAFLWWHYGPSLQLAIATIYTGIFLVLAVIDLEHGLLLNKIIYPALPLAMVFSFFFWPDLGLWRTLAGGAIGFGALFIIWAASHIFYSGGGMGEGDVKLAALIGLVTGFPLILIALQVAVVFGGLLAILLIALRIRGRKDAMPFGPFLAVGTMAIVYYGPEMWDIYIRWFTTRSLQ